MSELNSIAATLVRYAKERLELDPRDEIFVRNALSELLGLVGFCGDEKEVKYDSTDGLLNMLACELGIKDAEAEELKDKVMGLLSVSPRAVGDKFSRLCREKNGKAATDWFYRYCIANDYIKKDKLDKNPRFDSHGLVVTINKAKPEFRDPKKAVSGNSVAGGYPKCTICRENEGFGDRNKRTLRTVDIELDGNPWFWQYSPYGYFAEHGIAVNCKHTPMHIDKQTFYNLIDFVDKFPHYFLGCNAALPRIGGSVLAHDHYQGGGEILPLQKASVKIRLKDDEYSDVNVGILDWPGTVIRVESKDRDKVAAVCEKIRKAWVEYDDPALGIIAKDGDGEHNSISPTAVKTRNGYEMSVILRSNITSEKYPDGVFHAHPEYHVIKKESIGLIEAQGLFILPGRLEAQLAKVEECVAKGKLDGDLHEFGSVFAEVFELYKSGRFDTVHDAMKDELGSICYRILQNTAVFDDAHTLSFLKEIGINERI